MVRSDQYLLEMAIEGDRASFGELAQRWQQKIYGFIRRHVGNSDDARDLTQETLTKAYLNLDRLSDPTRFSSWVYTIALNECRMRFRKRGRFTAVPFEEYLESAEAGASTDTPERSLVSKESVTELQRAFQRLPEQQRAVIVMREYQDLKFHEIAEILQIPLSTVKSRMYLGLKTLRRLMEGE